MNFKIGAKCMLVFNIDLMDGLFNGATAVFLDVDDLVDVDAIGKADGSGHG